MTGKKARFSNEQEGGEDRISSLPDELIHHIMSFSDVSSAVQTSVLSKRWKFTWTTLPFLNFTKDKYMSNLFINFVQRFFGSRNYESQVAKLHLAFQSPLPFWVDWFTLYAISHNVEELNLDIASFGSREDAVELSTFSSNTLKELTLKLNFAELVESNWDLPALTTLRLIQRAALRGTMTCHLLDSCLRCLPSLKTLLLEGFGLLKSFSIPSLTSLHLVRCCLPQKVWDLPSLSTVTLEDVVFNESITFLSRLANLRNLILSFRTMKMTQCCIFCPRLVNLQITAPLGTTTLHSSKITVLAPKIRNFSSTGIFAITFGFCKLENVNIKLRGSTGLDASSKKWQIYYRQVIYMFPGLGNATTLTLDSEAIEALSSISNILYFFPSPFYNLKYVKVPQGYKESCVPAGLKRYLLDRSPKATIVNTLPQDDLIPQSLPACSSPRNLLMEKPSPTLLARAGDDRARSSKGPSDSGVWQGHEVYSEFIGLLDCISKKYPETFEYFTTNSKKLRTMKLNMLCTIVKNLAETSLTEVDTEMIMEYRAQFADLQRSFNVQWLVNHLNSIEQLHCSQSLLDHKLHALDSVGNIGEYLFSGP